MRVVANHSVYICFQSGISLYLQNCDSGGCEYDIIDPQRRIIDGGIIEDLSVDLNGIQVTDNLLQYILMPSAIHEDCLGVIFIRVDSDADALREAAA